MTQLEELAEQFAVHFENALREALQIEGNFVTSVCARDMAGQGAVNFQAAISFELGITVLGIIDTQNELELYIEHERARLDPLQAEKFDEMYERALKAITFLEAALVGPQAFYAARFPHP